MWSSSITSNMSTITTTSQGMDTCSMFHFIIFTAAIVSDPGSAYDTFQAFSGASQATFAPSKSSNIQGVGSLYSSFILPIIATIALEPSSFSAVNADEMKSTMTSLYTQPATQPATETTFEFGDFQGSSTTSAKNTNTTTTWPTSSATFSEDDNWASFESAFPPTKPPATSVAPTAFTQNYTSAENSTTTITTTAAAVNSSGPGQFAVFDEMIIPPTVDSSKVDHTIGADDGDKYAAFASLVTTTTHSGEDNDEFCNFEGSQPIATSNSDVVKVQYFTTQVSV